MSNWTITGYQYTLVSLQHAKPRHVRQASQVLESSPTAPLRSMFSTTLNEQSFNRNAIERQLGHSEPNAVRAAYNRAEYMDERRQIMQQWSNWLDNYTSLTSSI